MPEIVRFIMLSHEFLAAIQDSEGGTYIPRYALDVFLVFVRYYNLKVGGAWPSYATIEAETRHTHGTIGKAVADLRNRGYLKVLGRYGHQVLYAINISERGVILPPFNPPPSPVPVRSPQMETLSGKEENSESLQMDTEQSPNGDFQKSPNGDLTYIEGTDTEKNTDSSCPNSETWDVLSEEDLALFSLLGVEKEEREEISQTYGSTTPGLLGNKAAACILDLCCVLQISANEERHLRAQFRDEPSDLIRHLRDQGNGTGLTWIRISHLLGTTDRSVRNELITEYRDRPEELVKQLTEDREALK